VGKNKHKNKKERAKETLLSTLAYGSELESRAMLKEATGEDAKNTEDLQVKLARMYAVSPNKIDIEKKWAEIHPHKDFILKYTKPKEELMPLKPDELVELKKEETPSMTSTVIHDGYSNCSGNPNCSCNKMSNACGCSGFNGFSNASGNETSSNAIGNNQNAVMVVGIVSVVAILGIVLFLHQKNK